MQLNDSFHLFLILLPFFSWYVSQGGLEMLGLNCYFGQNRFMMVKRKPFMVEEDMRRNGRKGWLLMPIVG